MSQDSTIIALGRLIRVRNCIGEANIGYFTRFIFYHMIMCAYKFYLSIIVLDDEIMKTVRYIGIEKFTQTKMVFMALLRTIVYNQGVVFLCMWTFFTALALFGFFIYIMGKYMRDLTMNEEVKYERARESLLTRASKLIEILRKKNNITQEGLDKMDKEADKMNEWVVNWEKRLAQQSLLVNTIKLLFA